jgi:beta-N-acetylhexosaminidase
VVLAATALAGCDGGDAERAATERHADTATTAARDAEACAGEVGRVACALSLERKVAQLFLVGPSGAALVRERDLGGVVVEPGDGSDVGALARSVRKPVTAGTGGGRPSGKGARTARASPRIAPWVLAVQEGGEENAVPGIGPFAAAADVNSAGEAAAGARDSARSLRRLGVNGVLGPVVDVGVEAGGALGTRVYSDDPDEVAAYAGATVRAYRRAHLFSAAGHFPGIGSADASTAEAPATVGLTLPELRTRDLLPFAAAIKAGAPALMIGHALYPTTDFVVPASLSGATVTTLLRDKLGFEGVAITDDLTDPAVSLTIPAPKATVQAIQAGEDAVFISGPAKAQRAAYDAVLAAVRKGTIPRGRIDEAVRRLLAAKATYGLLPKTEKPSPRRAPREERPG